MIWFWKVMLKLTPIDSRLEIQCNTLPNNAIANVYQDMFPFKNNPNSSRARQPLFRGNLTGLTTPIGSISLRKKNTHTHANFFKNWLCPNFFCCPKIASCPNFGGAATISNNVLSVDPFPLSSESAVMFKRLARKLIL